MHKGPFEACFDFKIITKFGALGQGIIKIPGSIQASFFINNPTLRWLPSRRRRLPSQNDAWRRSGVFIVNFGHILNLVLMFLLLILNRRMPAGYCYSFLVGAPNDNLARSCRSCFCYICLFSWILIHLCLRLIFKLTWKNGLMQKNNLDIGNNAKEKP